MNSTTLETLYSGEARQSCVYQNSQGKWWYPWDGTLNNQPHIHLISRGHLFGSPNPLFKWLWGCFRGGLSCINSYRGQTHSQGVFPPFFLKNDGILSSKIPEVDGTNITPPATNVATGGQPTTVLIRKKSIEVGGMWSKGGRFFEVRDSVDGSEVPN